MKQPIRIISTDWHLTLDNISLKKKYINQMLDEADKLGCKDLIVAGDLFDERKAQPQNTLNSLGSILTNMSDRGFNIEIIKGNHDCTNYEGKESYLDEFKYHPNVKLYSELEYYMLPNNSNSLGLCFIPFFKEETAYDFYLEKALENVNFYEDRKYILITHISINGIFNNDKATIKNPLDKELFEPFYKVLIGHIHDRSKIGNNIFYIGSLNPDNFAEDNNKGYTILYDDGSHEYRTLDFVKYFNIPIDLEYTSEEEINKLFVLHTNSKDRIRFTFKGPWQKLAALDKSKYEMVGIEVRTKRLDIEQGVTTAKKGEHVSFNKEGLKTEFDKFCEINNINPLTNPYGKKYLNLQLK